MPGKRITLGLAVALVLVLVGAGAAKAVPPSVPPWSHEFPVYAPDGKTGWRAAWHLQGGAVSSLPYGARIGAPTRNGTVTGFTWRLSEPYVDGTAIKVQVQIEHSICLAGPGSPCAYVDGTTYEQEARSIHLAITGVECFNVATRQTREIFVGGSIANEGGNGYSFYAIGGVRGGTEETDPVSVGTLTLNETGSPTRCSSGEQTTSVFVRVKYVHSANTSITEQMSVLQYRVDGWRQDVDDDPSLEQCVLWFGEFYGPDWPERYDGKTPAEVGCDRWNRDPGDGFDAWCREAPEASFFVLKSEAPFFGLEIGWIPSWIGHYAECLFNPREGFDTTPIGEAAEEGWMGASRNILASVTGAFGGGGGGGMGAFHASEVGGQGRGVTWADDDHARALLGDDFVDGLNTGAVPVSPAGFGTASTPGCGNFVEELPVIGDGVSSCALGNAWPDSWRTAAGAVVMIMASFATLFGILRFMGVRYGWSTG